MSLGGHFLSMSSAYQSCRGRGIPTGWVFRAQRMLPPQRKKPVVSERDCVEGWKSTYCGAKSYPRTPATHERMFGGTAPECFPSTRQEGERSRPPTPTSPPSTTFGTDETTDQRPLCPNKVPHTSPKNTHSAVTPTHTQTHTAGMPSN